MAQAKHMAEHGSNTESPGSGHASPLTIGFCALAALACALFLELFRGTMHLHRTGMATGLGYVQEPAGILRSLAVVAIIFAIVLAALLLADRLRGLLDIIHRHRLVIGLAVVVACTALCISGSSIANWSWALGGEGFQGTLFGVPRMIRTDEWAVFTPFSISQSVTGNLAISPVLRGGGTDVTMVYAQPSWAVATLFRPFLWGYLVLGAERGLAFFWTARLVALALVTYEFGLLIADGRRSLAGGLAMLVVGSGAVQWWFAVNGTAELIIFGAGLVLALDRLLRAQGAAARWGWSALLAWLLPCYALILYPAWQVPFVYVFGAAGIWVIARWIGDTPAGERAPQIKGCLVSLVPCVLVMMGLAGFALASSWDAIKAVMESAYPGRRAEVGGGLLPSLMNGSTTLMSAISTDSFASDLQPNAAEAAAFFGLVPAGIVFGLARGLRRGDVLAIALGLASALLLAYGILGFPAPIAKLTALSNVTAARLLYPLGFADAALLMRGIALGDADERRSLPQALRLAAAIAASVAFAIALPLMGRFVNPVLMNRWCMLVTGIAALLLALAATLPRDVLEHQRSVRGTLVLAACATILVSGLCVNPVQRGTAALTGSDFYQAVARIAKDDPEARWVADDMYVSQACAAAGAPTVTSISTYPNIELWSTLDPEGDDLETYNRYAHVEVFPAEETSFELVYLDDFALNLNPGNAERIGVRYWASYSDLTSWSTERTPITPVAEAGPITIYRLG